ncbi:MAG: hypothetical protein KDK36_04235, partial [Leptospiraceae bacterium]|nr:hypothetical protein [Leptospiraceae bacterium]
MKFLLKFLILLLLSCTIIYSDDAENKIDARDLMEMDLDSAFKTIHKLNKEETDSLITKIRVEARKDYKEIDKFYLLISHLESMKAIEEEE